MKQTLVVGIFSGITFSGKSFFMRKFLQLQKFPNAFRVSMDEIRVRFWGDRSSSEAEKIYRNELVRQEIKTKLIIERAPQVLVEAPMLTNKFHQLPMVKAMDEATWYLQKMDKDAGNQGDVDVDLRVVFFFCSLKAVEKRVAYRNADPNDLSDVNSVGVYCWIARQLDIPTTYTPLFVDTTDEANNEANLIKITKFLTSGEYDVAENDTLRKLAEAYLEEAKRGEATPM